MDPPDFPLDSILFASLAIQTVLGVGLTGWTSWCLVPGDHVSLTLQLEKVARG